jgi:hypothetical protein
MWDMRLIPCSNTYFAQDSVFKLTLNSWPMKLGCCLSKLESRRQNRISNDRLLQQDLPFDSTRAWRRGLIPRRRNRDCVLRVLRYWRGIPVISMTLAHLATSPL